MSALRGLLLASLLIGCGDPLPPICETGPVAATGLTGALDGATPVVEIVALTSDPEAVGGCRTADRAWMYWDETTDQATLGAEPTSGVLQRDRVDATEDAIFFRDFNLGVRLDYEGGVPGPRLSLVWFSVGVDLATVTCEASDVLTCTP